MTRIKLFLLLFFLMVMTACSYRIPYKPHKESIYYLCRLIENTTGENYKTFIELGTAYRISDNKKPLAKKSGVIEIKTDSTQFELYKSSKLSTDSIPNIKIEDAINLYLNDQQAITEIETSEEMDMAMLYFYTNNYTLSRDCETGITKVSGRKLDKYLKRK